MAMTTAATRVLRVARSDHADAFVLIHVAHKGPASLDLTLTATEGECPYTALLKESRLKDLCVKNYQGSGDDWARIVSFVLGQSTQANDAALGGVEASASITGTGDDEDKELIVTIRKRVESITQRLGAIVLKQNDEQAIELFEWSGIAAARANAMELQVTGLQDKYRVAEDTIQKLNEQLKELTRAKGQHENQLMAISAQLLNEKKLKVRNQQRLLASATADAAKVLEIQAARGKTRGAAEPSRVVKRHARETDGTDEDTDEGFEQMDVDHKMVGDGSLVDQDTDDGERSTPQPLEEDENTATDNELDASTEAATPAARLDQAASSTRSSHPDEIAPPRRELPFARRGPSLATDARPAPDLAAEETAGETDDDEL